MAASLVQISWLPKQLAYGSYFAFGGSLFFFLNGQRKALAVLLPALAQMLWHFQTYAAEDFMKIPANRLGQFLLLATIILTIIILSTARLRRTYLDRKLGDLSYAMYLNHYVVAVLILNVTAPFSVGYLTAGLIGSLLLTEIMFVAAEKPLFRMRQDIREDVLSNLSLSKQEKRS